MLPLLLSIEGEFYSVQCGAKCSYFGKKRTFSFKPDQVVLCESHLPSLRPSGKREAAVSFPAAAHSPDLLSHQRRQDLHTCLHAPPSLALRPWGPVHTATNLGPPPPRGASFSSSPQTQSSCSAAHPWLPPTHTSTYFHSTYLQVPWRDLGVSCISVLLKFKFDFLVIILVGTFGQFPGSKGEMLIMPPCSKQKSGPFTLTSNLGLG